MGTKFLLIPLGLLASAVGGYFYGVDVGRDKIKVEWQKDTLEREEAETDFLLELKKTVVELRKKNEELSTRVSVEYRDRVRTVQTVKYNNVEVIKEVFQSTPFLTKGWVYAHDQLVVSGEIDPELASNEEPSDFTWQDSLETIAKNYGTAETARQKDIYWNDFYSNIRTNFDLSSVQQSRESARYRPFHPHRPS